MPMYQNANVSKCQCIKMPMPMCNMSSNKLKMTKINFLQNVILYFIVKQKKLNPILKYFWTRQRS